MRSASGSLDKRTRWAPEKEGPYGRAHVISEDYQYEIEDYDIDRFQALVLQSLRPGMEEAEEDLQDL